MHEQQDGRFCAEDDPKKGVVGKGKGQSCQEEERKGLINALAEEESKLNFTHDFTAFFSCTFRRANCGPKEDQT
jgi:hypothetical protein